MWYANTTHDGKWIFKQVDSAGTHIWSEFSSKHKSHFESKDSLHTTNQSRTNKLLRLFDGQHTFDGSEKREILARIGNRKIRGLYHSDFKFDHILCFSAETSKLLHTLRNCAATDAHGQAQVAKIHLLDVGDWNGHSDQEKCVNTMKEKLRQFAFNNLGWWKPSKSIKDGYSRTKQITIPEAGYYALIKDERKRLHDIRADTGCTFHISDTRPDDRRLISIVGKREKLDQAAARLAETW